MDANSVSTSLELTLLDEHQLATDTHWTLQAGARAMVGRGGDSDIELTSKRVSRIHAVIFEYEAEWICTNFGRSGSFANGESFVSTVLYDGVVLQFARSGPFVRVNINGPGAKEESDFRVTKWIRQLADGNREAAENLWNKYFPQVVQLARFRLGASYRRVADEEDIAVSVFDSLYSGLAAGRFPELTSGDNLWRLLAVMTARKVIKRVEHERRQKRGGGSVRGESVFWDEEAEGRTAGIEHFAANDPAPDFAISMAEEADGLMAMLDNDMQQIARMRLDGCTNEEIGERIGCNARTVQRRLQTIRTIWSRRIGEES